MSEPRLLTIVMPCYNEAATLRIAVKRMLETELPMPFEVLVVDDGSKDGCLDTISDFEDEGRIRVVRHKVNQGKGAAVRTGIAEAGGDLLTILDTDLEYDPSDYRQLLEPILSGEARVAYGTRSFGAHTAYSFWHVIGNKGVTLYANLIYNTWLTDLETCLKVAETELWRAADIRSNGFGLEAEITGKLLRSGHRIYEAPISYRARSREEGKKLTWIDGLEAVWVLTKIRFARRR